MRAPGAPLGTFALESAMDELAYATGVDPVELRLRNYAERDENQGKAFTSKELRACYRLGAERFGWAKRKSEPRSMREGRELIGWGMATGVWEAQMTKTSARAVLTADGKLEVATATADIGTGTYTILTQIGADALGLAMEDVTARIADTTLPQSPVEGGSWTAASAGSAVEAACRTVRAKLFEHASALDGSPLAGAAIEDITFANGRLLLTADPSRSMTIAAAMKASGVDRIEAEETASPSMLSKMRYVSYTHSAIFAEVRVDEELGQIRVTRIVNAVAAGRILNPKTARSQVLGGVVWGIGMALHEETFTDHRLGRFMNHNLAEYHVPVNADVHDIEVIFVAEQDDQVSPMGVKGLGEIGIVGTPAALANAVYHATRRRIRSLPITIDKVLAGERNLPYRQPGGGLLRAAAFTSDLST
jgi:xanthine dehydrogenase YagR molybdenum-binding subunit